MKEVTAAFIPACGGKPEGLQIVISDVEKEDWGSGDELAADKYPG